MSDQLPPPAQRSAPQQSAPQQSAPQPPAPQPSAPQTSPATRPVEAYVLLDAAPADMGEVLSSIQPGMGDPLTGMPLMPEFGLTVNGADIVIGALGAPLTAPGLQADLATSPLRATLEPAVGRHQAAIRLAISPPADFSASMTTWANVLAYLLDRDDAHAVWLPHQRQVTTDVMFIGWMERFPAANLTSVHAMWLDGARTTSLAFTSGLTSLGGRELQLRAPGEPAALHGALRDAVAAVLAEGRLPRPDSPLVLGQTPHRLVEGTGVVDGAPVFDLVPLPPTQQAAEAAQPKKRRWPFG